MVVFDYSAPPRVSPHIRAGAIYAKTSTVNVAGVTSFIDNMAFDGGEVCACCEYTGML